VTRAKKVLLEYQDPTGRVRKKWFSGFRAVIVQHEIDHLAGVLFTQRAIAQKAPMYEEKDGKLSLKKV
jgi:peptide deformylase